MVKAHPIEIGSRVIAFVEEGHSHREAARHFRVSPRFVNDMVILKRENGAWKSRRGVGDAEASSPHTRIGCRRG